MNPEVTVEEEKVKVGKSERTLEKWVLKGSTLHNSMGCSHDFVQKTAGTVECTKCGLGLFGHASNGKLV